MRQIITGRDIGTTIDFRSAGTHEARHPWPPETVVSAGKGIVFHRDPKPGEPGGYSTLFMEVYPPGASFIRGEGDTPAECEDRAWEQYRRALDCADGSGGHRWEPRGYRNGAGFCARCGTFGADVFTGEQLGQHCRDCGVGTTYHWEDDPKTGETVFLCRDHYRPSKTASLDNNDDRSPLGQLLRALAAPEEPEDA